MSKKNQTPKQTTEQTPVERLASNAKATDAKAWDRLPFEDVQKMSTTLKSVLIDRRAAEIERLKSEIAG